MRSRAARRRAKSSAAWYDETAKRVYRPDLYEAAAKLLVTEGYLAEDEVPFGSDGYKPETDAFIDGIAYDGRDPIGYLNAHKIGNKDDE